MSEQAIGWIVTLAFVVLLVIGFFIGFWRGWKRSLLNLLWSAIGMVVGIFVTKPITQAILGITVQSDGTKITLNQWAVNQLRQIEDVSLLMDGNPSFNQFINGLPMALANTVVFLCVSAAIGFVMYLIYKIFCIIVKYRPAEKKHRMVGGLVGAVKMFALSILAFMPLTSLIGLASDMTERESYLVSTEATSQTGSQYGYIGEYLPQQAIIAIRGTNNSLLGRICGLGGMDDKMFDYLAEVKVDKEKVNVREEVSSYYEVLAFKYDLEHTTGLKFSNVNYEKLGVVLDKLTESPFFTKVVSSTLAEMVINYEDYSFLQGLKSDYGKILDNIGASLNAIKNNGGDVSSYFSSDVKNALEVFKTLGESGIIDDIKSLETKNVDKIIQTVANDKNADSLEKALKSLFKMNTAKDSVVELLKKYSDDLIDGLEPIGTDTSAWTEEDWSGCASEITAFAKDYARLTDKIALADALTDIKVILEDEKYKIEEIMPTLGKLIDDAKAIRLLTTAKNEKDEGHSIFEDLLSKNNLTLPKSDEVIKDATGEVKITSFEELFTFITPSLKKLKDSTMYDIISSESTDKVEQIASLISQEGNEDLLKEIILPLNQVEPTKSLIMENLTSSFGSGFVDLNNLSSYEEWDKDLGYISKLLIILNETKISDETSTYLNMILNSKIDDVFNDITTDQVDSIIKPILYAKSTNSLKSDIMDNIADKMNELTGASNTISLQNVTLEEGNENDQVEEICRVLKALISLRGSENAKLKDMDANKLTELFTALQTNGYRELTGKDEGVFKEIFGSMMMKLKTELSESDEVCQTKYGKTTVEKLEEMCGTAGYLQEANYGKIDFANMFDQLTILKDDLTSTT